MSGKADSATPDPIAVAVGERVTEERDRRKMTKEELADAAGLASRYLWRVEDGRQNITLRNLAAIAAGLRLPLWKLMRGVEEKAGTISTRSAADADRPETTTGGPEPEPHATRPAGRRAK